jgi:hypothetical protein
MFSILLVSLVSQIDRSFRAPQEFSAKTLALAAPA